MNQQEREQLRDILHKCSNDDRELLLDLLKDAELAARRGQPDLPLFRRFRIAVAVVRSH